MNFICLIMSKETKEVVQIPLSCRAYHANKLQYVLGRTLCNCDSIVVPSDHYYSDEELDSLCRSENSLNFLFGKSFDLRLK